MGHQVTLVGLEVCNNGWDEPPKLVVCEGNVGHIGTNLPGGRVRKGHGSCMAMGARWGRWSWRW